MTLAESRAFKQAKTRTEFLATKRATKQRATRRAFLKEKEATAARSARRERLRAEETMIQGRPNDERRFVHKKLLGLATRTIKTFVPGASTAFGIGEAALGVIRGGGRRTPPRTGVARITPRSIDQRNAGAELKFGGEGISFAGGGPCDFPRVTDSAGRCRMPTSGATGGPQFDVGEAVMGRYGAALEPGSMIVDRAVCLRGMQLADDGLCYNKSQITNKQRMWPAGRRPLLSGGDMRAIGIAARAGRRLEGATKRLRRLGMMKAAPVRRSSGPKGKALVLKEAGPGGIVVQ